MVATARSALMLGPDNPFDASARLTSVAALASRAPELVRPGVDGDVWVVTFRVRDASNDAWIVLVDETGRVYPPGNMQRVPRGLDTLPDLAEAPGSTTVGAFPPAPPPGGFTREQVLARVRSAVGTDATAKLTTWDAVVRTAPPWFPVPWHDPRGRAWIVFPTPGPNRRVDWCAYVDDETGASDVFTGRDDPPTALLALPDLGSV